MKTLKNNWAVLLLLALFAGGATAYQPIVNAMLASMAQGTFKGRAASSGTGVPVDLTATQATAILNAFVGDSGSGGTKGLVPAPGSGDAAADKFLHADGTWRAFTGGGASPVPLLTKTADYTILSADYNDAGELVVLCNGTTAAVTITLSTAADDGFRAMIKNIGTRDCYVVRASSDDIEGYTSLTIPPGGFPANGYQFTADGGTRWYVF